MINIQLNKNQAINEFTHILKVSPLLSCNKLKMLKKIVKKLIKQSLKKLLQLQTQYKQIVMKMNNLSMNLIIINIRLTLLKNKYN